jgi:hypothetical protein
MLEFRELLAQCDLHDLGFRGRPWTFDNKQSGERNVKVRLDWVVASPSWSDWFPNASVQYVVSSRSDHCPILLCMEPDDNRGANKRAGPVWNHVGEGTIPTRRNKRSMVSMQQCAEPKRCGYFAVASHE